MPAWLLMALEGFNLVETEVPVIQAGAAAFAAAPGGAAKAASALDTARAVVAALEKAVAATTV